MEIVLESLSRAACRFTYVGASLVLMECPPASQLASVISMQYGPHPDSVIRVMDGIV